MGDVELLVGKIGNLSTVVKKDNFSTFQTKGQLVGGVSYFNITIHKSDVFLELSNLLTSVGIVAVHVGPQFGK